MLPTIASTPPPGINVVPPARSTPTSYASSNLASAPRNQYNPPPEAETSPHKWSVIKIIGALTALGLVLTVVILSIVFFTLQGMSSRPTQTTSESVNPTVLSRMEEAKTDSRQSSTASAAGKQLSKEEETIAAYLGWLQDINRARNDFIDKADEQFNNTVRIAERHGWRGIPNEELAPYVEALSSIERGFRQFIAHYDTSNPPRECQALHTAYRSFLELDKQDFVFYAQTVQTYEAVAHDPFIREQHDREEARLDKLHRNAQNQCYDAALAIWQAHPNLPDSLFNFDDLFELPRESVQVRPPTFNFGKP